MTSAAQNSFVAFRPLPLPSEVKISTFSMLPIVISESVRPARWVAHTEPSLLSLLLFNTFTVPKSRTINGQATSPPLLLSGVRPSPPPPPLFLEGKGKPTEWQQRSHSPPRKDTKTENDQRPVWSWREAWWVLKIGLKMIPACAVFWTAVMFNLS